MEGVALVSLGALLGRTWSSVTNLVRPPTAAALFRRALEYRNAGRYDEAARLVAEGIERAPQSGLGHLLAAYLHVARHENEPATLAFRRVLALDPYHPRALLGLARIALEENDVKASVALLDRALRFYPDFPEARALQEKVASGPGRRAVTAAAAPAGAPPMAARDLELGIPARDLAVTRADGSVVRARVDDERAQALAHHMAQVHRMASATLARAGLGPLRRGVVETGGGMTLLVSDAGLILSATVDGQLEIGAGLIRIGELGTKLGIKANPT
jgi:tetratricopeptide (TPR) repeat protein